MQYIIPDHILKIMHLMEEHNFSPYLVGGCVRDFIMGKTPHDYDITVGVLPEKISELFEANGFRTIPKGRKFGTVGVLVENEVVEITPYRIESEYNDSRHPDKVEFVKDIKIDLTRRDFTINAMAMATNGNILDIFGGTDDIKNKILRCVGNPDERFREDALRILRAIRFSSRLSFSIEAETRMAMSKNSALLGKISSERIYSELKGTLFFPHSYDILTECNDIICSIIPGFVPHEFLRSSTGDFPTRLFSCICHNSFDEICEICSYLKLSNYETDKITSMHTLYNSILTRNGKKIIFDEKTKKALCDYKPEYIEDLFIFFDSFTDELYNFLKNGVYTTEKLAISGGDIALMGIFPKTETAKILRSVLYQVSLGKVLNKKTNITQFLFDLQKNQSE
ncbi:MAG: hypothetical protein IKI97_07545 [Clostridia bacterium]|nr:hypothetical protein [Clostridia bacterium]